MTPALRVWHQIVVERLRDAIKEYVARRPEWLGFAARPPIISVPELFRPV